MPLAIAAPETPLDPPDADADLRARDAAAADAAYGRVKKSCTACHDRFRDQ